AAHQVVDVHGSAAADLTGHITVQGHLGQRLGASPPVTTSAELWRVDVQDLHPGADGAASAAAQHHPITDREREGTLEDEPGVVAAQGTYPGGDRGGAHMDDQLRRRLVETGADYTAHVDGRSQLPGPRGQQRIAAAEVIGVDTTQVHRGPADRSQGLCGAAAALHSSDHHCPGPASTGHLEPVLRAD